MNILVCVKRVPATAGKITLTADEQAIDTRYLGFTVSPHEECAVEEAVRIVEAHGGTSTVLTLGPEEATDQLREAMAVGIDRRHPARRPTAASGARSTRPRRSPTRSGRARRPTARST